MQMLDFASSTIKTSGGNVLRYAGDAILAEFTSAVVAVKAAVEIQSELSNRNSNFDSDKKVLIRIGINVGDVIKVRGEVYGDGINLAARLEAAAPEGGVCISSIVHDQIHGKIETVFEDCGNESFKNIARPTHVFRWVPIINIEVNKTSKSTSGRSPEKPSIYRMKWFKLLQQHWNPKFMQLNE
jgi:adenylate cyclase